MAQTYRLGILRETSGFVNRFLQVTDSRFLGVQLNSSNFAGEKRRKKVRSKKYEKTNCPPIIRMFVLSSHQRPDIQTSK